MEIYILTNTITNKVYIGKSANANKRLERHLWNAKDDAYQTNLYRSIRKHGSQSFVMHILESNISAEDIDQLEIEYIAKYDSFENGYNMTLGGEGADTSSSQKFIEAMKRYHANKTPESYASNGMLGKTHTAASKQRQSISQTKAWANATDEQRESRNRKVSGKKNGMYGISPANATPVLVEGKEYPSLAKAAKAYNLSPYFLKKQHAVQKVLLT